jgi:hypothetical protein
MMLPPQWPLEWRSSLRGFTTVPGLIQAVSHPAVFGSPIGRRTIVPGSSGFGRGRLSL